MSDLATLPNIAKKLEAQLNAVGIFTPEQLFSSGSRNAWLSILKTDSSACYNRLCALEGAIQGVRWHSLDEQTKQSLKQFYLEQKNSIAKPGIEFHFMDKLKENENRRIKW